MPEPGVFTRLGKRISVLLGLAIGLGFTRNLHDAYCFLMDNYEENDITRHNPDVAIVRQAVSIDERRCCFRHNLMDPDWDNPAQDVRNVWFAGAHSDVGGGYPEAESGLSKLTLEWRAREAKAAGLIMDNGMLARLLGQEPSPRGTLHVTPDPAGMLHESLKGFWWVMEILPRRQWNPRGGKMCWAWAPARPRSMPNNPFVHRSVEGRMQLVPAYRPVNLPAKYQVVD